MEGVGEGRGGGSRRGEGWREWKRLVGAEEVGWREDVVEWRKSVWNLM